MPQDATATTFDALIAENKESLIIVDFWADWCGPCHAVAPILEKIEDEYGGDVVVLKIDVDTEGELADRFNIRSIPTLIFFNDGIPEEVVAGPLPYRSLVEIVDAFL